MRLTAVLVALMFGATAVHAQARVVDMGAQAQRFAIWHSGSVLQQRSGGSAFGVEFLGGSVGALAGGAIIWFAREECDVEATVCILESLAVAGIGTIVGATAGTYLAGKAADTQPSLFGAGLGAVLGLAAGVGVVKLLDEADVRGEYIPIIALTVTEGAFAALGSRLLSRNH
jgi:hypothetical protein